MCTHQKTLLFTSLASYYLIFQGQCHVKYKEYQPFPLCSSEADGENCLRNLNPSQLTQRRSQVLTYAGRHCFYGYKMASYNFSQLENYSNYIIINFEMSFDSLQLFPLVSLMRMRKRWSGQFLHNINSWDYPLRDKTFPAVNDHCQASLGLTLANSPPNTAKTQLMT